MDNLIQKFYSNGKEEEQKYTQFGAFSNSLMKNSKLNFIKPNIGVINPAIHNVETNTKIQIPKTPNKEVTSNETFLKPKKLIFNSSSDLFNQNIPRNNFAYSTKDNIEINKDPILSLNTIKQNINIENKKNSTKMQMMEEKMKNLELKSQRLEVINDFFFDMFENNLVKEELKRQKGIKEEKEKEEDEKEETEEPKQKNETERKKKRKKNPNAINEEEEYMKEFIEKTDKFSRKYLKTVKNDIGLALVEKQLKKNEILNDITEEILDLKGDLMNKLERLEMKQKADMKTIAYCLQNSGDEKVENLATRLFGDNILKPEEENLNFNTNMNSMNTTDLKFTGSVFKTNLFRRNSIQQRRNLNDDKKLSSIDGNNDDNRLTRKTTTNISDKNEDNRIRRKSTLLNDNRNIIIEEKGD